MKLLSLLVVVVLCAISSVDCGCYNENRIISTPDNSKHVLCIQFKNSDCLHCKANGNYYKCDTKPAVNSNPAADKGPAPNGYYAIGAIYTHGTHGISWANLHPRKQNGNGWWNYYRANPDVPGSRSHIGLHPGRTSRGCVTVTGSYCWSNLESMLKSKTGDTITTTKRFWKTATVNRVGILRVMN